jgi:hypothetical protein
MKINNLKGGLVYINGIEISDPTFEGTFFKNVPIEVSYHLFDGYALKGVNDDKNKFYLTPQKDYKLNISFVKL